MDTAAVSNGASASGGAPAAALSPPNKRRWLQFRLRTLLILVALLCLGLGGWQIFLRHFASFVAADPVPVGHPIHVRGRLFDFRGDSTVFAVAATKPDSQAPLGYIICQSGGGRLERTGRWTSEFEIDMPNVLTPGEYRLEFHPIHRPPAFSKLLVLPNDDSDD